MTLSEKKEHEKHLVLYFQVHQPCRLNAINFFDIPAEPAYFDDRLNESIIRRIADNCYLPANLLLLELIEKHPEIKIVFSFSGLAIEQLQAIAPEALASFQKLVRTGNIELLAETYYHSLASLVTGDEFEVQVLQHAEKMYEVFGVRPEVFRNTELIYSDDIGRRVAHMGFRGIFTEGYESVLGDRNPHALYHHPDLHHFKLFLRNYRLSDDIAFRFVQSGSRLDVHQYISWLDAIPTNENIINLAMDYETFGEHHHAESGIFDFLHDFLTAMAEHNRISLSKPSEILASLPNSTPLLVENCLSWGDVERDMSAWLGNEMQRDAFNTLMTLEDQVKALGDESLLRCWRYLQTSDHFYYMSTKSDTDGSIHSYFSPFPSAYDAFINFMNVVSHLAFRIRSGGTRSPSTDQDLSSNEAERQGVRATTPVWVMNLKSIPHGNVPETHD